MIKRILAGCLLSGLGLQAAQAGCKEDIQAMMKAGETAENYRLETETLIGGTPIQHSTQYYKDYSHFHQVVKETGVNWMVLGNQEYTSSDGKAWEPYRTRDSAWLEKTLAANEATRASIKDVVCGAEVLDGINYKKYSYVQETKEPAAVSAVAIWLDPATELPAKRYMKTELSGQVIETNVVITWGEEIMLPKP